MIKKISAVFLALVLCLSVVVLPASATGFTEDYQFSDGKRLAYKVELDKESYNPGETVTVKVYVRADTGVDLDSGCVLLGVNSNQIDKTESANTNGNIASVTTYNSDLFGLWFSAGTPGWQPELIAGRVEAESTAEEQAAYDTYIKFQTNRDRVSGTHQNAANSQAGLPAEDFNATDEPFFTTQFKLRDDISAGTTIQIGIPSGGAACKPPQNYFRTYVDGSTRSAYLDTSLYDYTEAVATATVGTAGPVVSRSNAQVKMTRISDTEVADEFSFRVISTISDADWDMYFGNTAAGGNTNAIQKLGFVAYKGTDGFDMDIAKSAAQTAAVDEQATLPEGYFVAWTDYVQKVDDNSDAYFGARIDTTEQTCSDVTYIGVVQYLDANEETAYAFYETAEQTLLKTNYDKIVEYYLEQTK